MSDKFEITKQELEDKIKEIHEFSKELHEDCCHNCTHHDQSWREMRAIMKLVREITDDEISCLEDIQ